MNYSKSFYIIIASIFISIIGLDNCSKSNIDQKMPLKENNFNKIHPQIDSVDTTQLLNLSNLSKFRVLSDLRKISSFHFCNDTITEDELSSYINEYLQLYKDDISCDLKFEMKVRNKKQITELIERIILKSKRLYPPLLIYLPLANKASFLYQSIIDSIAFNDISDTSNENVTLLIRDWYVFYKYLKIHPKFYQRFQNLHLFSTMSDSDSISNLDLLKYYYGNCDSLGWN